MRQGRMFEDDGLHEAVGQDIRVKVRLGGVPVMPELQLPQV